MMIRPILALFLTLVAQTTHAQITASLLAATAQASEKPEVRLRWKPGATGLPIGGYRLYRTDGSRRMISQTSPPAPPELTRFNNPVLRSKALQSAQLHPLATLGATDTQVTMGATISYQLMGVDGTGKESPLDSIKDFRVGADPQPPAPLGLAATPEDGEVSLRWSRLPEAQELALNGVSYRLLRDGKPLHKKPLVILDNQESDGNDEFFVDTLDAPAPLRYQLTLVDGFGRTSPPAQLAIAVPDWRKPSEISLAIGRLDELKLRTTQLLQRLPTAKSLVTARRAEITWLPAQGSLSPIRYILYRQDLDNISSPPLRLTPTPIEGTPVASTPELLDDLLGEIPLEDEASRAERVAAAKQRARLTMQLRVTPARRFTDTTIQPDRRYRYLITALFTLNNLETEPTITVPVEVPTSVPPGALTGLASSFQVTPPPTAERFVAPALFKQNQVRSSLGLRKQLPPQRNLQPFSFLSRDDGGTMTLRWTVAAGQLGVLCKLTRKDASVGALPTFLGTTKPNATSFMDRIPRGISRRFIYTLTPISRWGVPGSPSTMTVETPATLAPSPPIVLSGTPGELGTVVLTLQPNTPAESVSEYVVRVDNNVVAHTATPQGENLILTVSNAPLGSYTVIARNGTARLDSPASEALRISPLIAGLAAPSGLRAQATSEGVTLTWSPVGGALGYVVSRREGTASPVRLGGRTTQVQLRDVTTLGKKTYTYRVITVSPTGLLSPPAEVTIVTP